VRTLALPLSAALVATACRGDLTVWTPPPPPDADANSAIFLYQPAGRPAFAFVVPVVEGRPVRAAIEVPDELPAPEDGTVSAFYYEDTITQLRLPEGLLPDTSDPRPCALAQPRSAFQQNLGEASWAPRALLLSPNEQQVVLGQAACQAVDLCLQLSGELVELPAPDSVSSMFPIADDRVLVTNLALNSFVVGPDSVTTTSVSTGWAPSTGLRLPSGELWIGGAHGRVARGSWPGPWQQLPIPDRADFLVSAFSVSPDGSAMFALSVRAKDETTPTAEYEVALDRHDATGWRQLHRSRTGAARSHAAAIVWLDTQRAVFTYRDVSYLVWDGRAVRKVSPDQNELVKVAITALAMPEGQVDPWMGADDGRVYRLDVDEERIQPLDVAVQALSAVERLVAFRNGVLVGAQNGWVFQAYPGAMPCQGLSLARSDAELIVQLPGTLVISGGNPDWSRPNSVAWVTLP
jgi:hypothetical protein